MGIRGRHVSIFEVANLATATGVHMNGDYEFFYDVLKVEPAVDWGGVTGEAVTVKSHKTGKISTHRIISGPGYEYFEVIHSGMFQRIFKCPPELIKVVPFKGERFE